MTELSVHNVKKLGFTPITQLPHTLSFSRRLVIKGDRGNNLEVVFFSDDIESLQFGEVLK